MSFFNISDENVSKLVSVLYMFIDGRYRKLCDEVIDILKKGQINNLYVLSAQDEESSAVVGIFTSIDNMNIFIKEAYPKCKKSFTEKDNYLAVDEDEWIFLFYEVVPSNNIDKINIETKKGGTITEEQEHSLDYEEE